MTSNNSPISSLNLEFAIIEPNVSIILTQNISLSSLLFLPFIGDCVEIFVKKVRVNRELVFCKKNNILMVYGKIRKIIVKYIWIRKKKLFPKFKKN
jgi:hypothetical protein